MSKHHPPYPQFALYHVITNNCTITKISISSIHALIITYSPSRLLPLAPSFHQLSDTPKHFQAIDFVKFSLLVVASFLDSLAPVVLCYNILFPFSNPSSSLPLLHSSEQKKKRTQLWLNSIFIYSYPEHKKLIIAGKQKTTMVTCLALYLYKYGSPDSSLFSNFSSHFPMSKPTKTLPLFIPSDNLTLFLC